MSINSGFYGVIIVSLPCIIYLSKTQTRNRNWEKWQEEIISNFILGKFKLLLYLPFLLNREPSSSFHSIRNPILKLLRLTIAILQAATQWKGEKERKTKRRACAHLLGGYESGMTAFVLSFSAGAWAEKKGPNQLILKSGTGKEMCVGKEKDETTGQCL